MVSYTIKVINAKTRAPEHTRKIAMDSMGDASGTL